MEVIRIIKDESLIFGKTSLDVNSSLDPKDVTSFSPVKALETKEVNLGGWYVDVEATLSEKSKIEQDYILLIETKANGLQPFRVHNKEVKKRRVLARAYHVMFDSEMYLVEEYSASNLATGTVLNGLNNNLDRTSPFTYVVSHAGSITMDFSGMTLLEAWEFLVDNKAALVEADWYRIYFRNELGEDRGVTISHGKDLEDIVGTEDWSTVVTKIFPYTSGGVTLPEKYLMSETQYNRPYTRRVEIEVDVEAIKEQYPDYTDEQLIPLIQAQLRINAERYLEDAQYPQVTYRVSSNVAEDLNLWDKILVKHPAITYNLPLEGPVDQEAIDRLGIPTKVLSYQYDVIAKRTIKLDYGDFYANFSKLFNNKLDKITEEWKRVENNLEERLNAQTELINNWNKKGHMVLLENEILFLDKLPMGDAENVLKIGLGGIAFSKTGVDGDFTSAWDLEGNFNTEFIGAGSITVNQLSSDVGSSLDLSSNESVNILVTDKVIEEVDKIEIPPGEKGDKGDKGDPGAPGKDGDEWEIGPNGNWYKNGVDTGLPSQGPKGPAGEEGPPGPSGASQYTHIRYSANANGNPFTPNPGGDTEYIGIAVTNSPTAPTSYTAYTWAKFRGEDGEEGPQGIPGTDGEDGVTYYTWIKYANTPTSGMSDSPAGKDYIGIAYNKLTPTESTIYSDYEWSLMRGPQGPQGIPGEKGADGQSQYTHIRYSANANGSGFVHEPIPTTKYIGIAITTTATAPASASAYTWSRYVGEDGAQGPQGIQGPPGPDGNPTYTWIKYANTPTSGMSDYPEGKAYIGIANNQSTPTESTNYEDYQWSLIKGDSVYYAYADEIDRYEPVGDNLIPENARQFESPPWVKYQGAEVDVTPAPMAVFNDGYSRNLIGTFNMTPGLWIDSQGVASMGSLVRIGSDFIEISGGEYYTLKYDGTSYDGSAFNKVVAFYDDLKIFIERKTFTDTDEVSIFKAPLNARYLRLAYATSPNTNPQAIYDNFAKLEKGDNPNPTWTPAWEDLSLEDKPVSFIETSGGNHGMKYLYNTPNTQDIGHVNAGVKVKNISEKPMRVVLQQVNSTSTTITNTLQTNETRDVMEVFDTTNSTGRLQLQFRSETNSAGDDISFYAYNPSVYEVEERHFSGFSLVDSTKKWRGYRVGLESSNDPYDYQWELSPNEIQKTLVDHEARIEVNSEGIRLEASTREESISGLSNTLLETSGELAVLSDQVNVEISERLTSAEGRIETANQIINTVDESVQTFTSRIETVEGELEEHQAVYRRDASGITLGGTDWETTMHADGENLTFISEGGDVKAQFGANGMYTNRWLTDFHALEKFEEGNIRLTIWRDRRIDD